MESHESDEVKCLPTEEMELLREATPLRGLHLPPNGIDVVYFPIDEDLSQYLAPSPDSVKHILMQMLSRAKMTLGDVNVVLASFNQAINSKTSTESEVMDPEATTNDYTVDFLPKYCLGVAAVLFLVFFILVILSSYYVNDSNLAYVAIAFVALGLSMHLCVILFNGDFRVCKKRYRISNIYLHSRQRRLVDCTASIANKVFNKKFLNWKMEPEGKWVELRDMTLQRSISTKTLTKK